MTMEQWAVPTAGGLQAVFALISVAVALGASPGPATIYVAAHSLRHGHVCGVVAAAGLCAGAALTCLISSIALSSAIMAEPELQWFFRKIATVYLLFLAIMTARQRPRREEDVSLALSKNVMIFVGGCLLNAVNPYQYSFYIVIIPAMMSTTGQ